MSEQPSCRGTRIVQVSDTHLSASHAYFVDNFRALAAEVQASPPALLVHTGDVSFNGPETVADLAFARAEMERLPAPWRIIPGNHDIGEAPRHARLDQPLTDARLAAWRRHFGAQWWAVDIASWRLVGIDTSLLASDRSEEVEQRRFLIETLASRAGRPVMLFMHMPPFVDDPDDPRPSTACVPHEAREPLLQACRTGGVRVIACGHLHVYRRMHWQGIEIVWAPCTSFVHIARWQAHFGGFARSGYVEWTLAGGQASHRLVEPPSLVTHDMGRWSDTYGTTTKLPARPLAGDAPAG